MGVEYLSVGPEYFKLTKSLNDLLANYTKYESNGELKGVLTKIIASGQGFFKNYNSQIDQEIFNLLTKEYFKKNATQDLSKVSLEVDQLTKLIYEKSIFTNEKRFTAFLSNFNSKSLKKTRKGSWF
jgi:hypothetical protein